MEEEGGKERETETAKDSNEIPYFVLRACSI